MASSSSSPPEFPPTWERLRPYVSSLTEPVYALKNLPEEVVAVLFAYYSRSEKGLRENLLELLKEDALGMGEGAPGTTGDLSFAEDKARAFHEKWVVGYGHASVAEHGVVHLALEDISIVASKVVEDMRLASYTEKSTRYVQFERGRCVTPPELINTPGEAVFQGAMDHLFGTYTDLIEPLTQAIMERFPPKPNQRPRAVARACRARALDALRALLPAATRTNVGLTLNGRALAHLISKLKSHPLKECHALGDAMAREAQAILPTLVKYADARPYYQHTPEAIAELSRSLLQGSPPGDTPAEGLNLEGLNDDGTLGARVTLGGLTPGFEETLVAAILFRHSALPFDVVQAKVGEMSETTRDGVLSAYLKDRGPHDAPLRELEHVYGHSDILLDYGAFRDIQRHRMATQTPQTLGVSHGFVTPEPIGLFGFTEPFNKAMDAAATAHQALLPYGPEVASYVVPLAYRLRCLFTWNIRELFHFIELRSAPQGHRSYRRVAQALYHDFAAQSPHLASFVRVTLGDAALGRLKSEERAEAKREALRAKGVEVKGEV